MRVVRSPRDLVQELGDLRHDPEPRKGAHTLSDLGLVYSCIRQVWKRKSYTDEVTVGLMANGVTVTIGEQDDIRDFVRADESRTTETSKRFAAMQSNPGAVDGSYKQIVVR